MPFLELRLNVFALVCLAVLNKLGCFLVLPLGSQGWQLFFPNQNFTMENTTADPTGWPA